MPLEKPLLVPILAVLAIVLIAVIVLILRAELTHSEATVTFELPDGGLLNVSCEVADTALKRSEGLQHRDDLPIDEGMLFVFDEPREATFIMHNVRFPLDIVFVAEDGTVLKVEEAEVEEPGTPDEDLTRYRSEGKVKWVVEMNRGLSAQFGIGPGTKVTIEFHD